MTKGTTRAATAGIVASGGASGGGCGLRRAFDARCRPGWEAFNRSVRGASAQRRPSRRSAAGVKSSKLRLMLKS